MRISLDFRQVVSHLFVRSRRFKQVSLVFAVLLFVLLLSAIFFVSRAYLEGQEIREYVGGPFSSQLLYLQGCATGTADGGGQISSTATLEAQFDACRRSFGGRPGYYIYDFNIKRSVALTKGDMESLREYEIFRFPDSILGKVEESQTNLFNTIIPLEDFSGFNYDCALGEDGDEASCSLAPLKCDVSSDAINCNVFNPDTGRFENHAIKRDRALDILIPQGLISGPDLFKLLKPRFFPVLERM